VHGGVVERREAADEVLHRGVRWGGDKGGQGVREVWDVLVAEAGSVNFKC
jgi:hypothetical protein